MDVENTSGQGPASRVPPEIQGWNWGVILWVTVPVAFGALFFGIFAMPEAAAI